MLSARERLAAIVRRRDGEIDLAEAALVLAQEERADLDVERYLGMLRALGAELARRLNGVRGPRAQVGALNRLLFDEQGFRGDTVSYYDPRNSLLDAVIDRRLGIPITLSLVYIEVGRAAGLDLQGVGFPAHFLTRLRPPTGPPLLIDVFHGGQVVDEAELEARLKEQFGERAGLQPQYVVPVTARQFLTRVLNNLKGAYLRQRQFARALSAVERLLVISPWALDEIRDRGLLHLQLDNPAAALADLETYLRYCADAPDAHLVQRQVALARRALER